MKRPRFDVYEAKDGWRWRLLAANGRTIADSGEAYTRKRDVERAVTATIAAAETIGHGRMIQRLKAGSTVTMAQGGKLYASCANVPVASAKRRRGWCAVW